MLKIALELFWAEKNYSEQDMEVSSALGNRIFFGEAETLRYRE